MKKILKRTISFVLSLIMMLTCIPSFVVKSEAAEFIDEAELYWNYFESADDAMNLYENVINYKNGTVSNEFDNLFENRSYAYYEVSFDNDGYFSSTSEINDKVDQLQLGGTYYCKINFTANSGYEFNDQTIIDTNYPTDDLDLVVEDATHAYCIFEFKCKEIYAVYSKVNAPVNSGNKKPSDFTMNDYIVQLAIYDYSDDCENISFHPTSVEYYNDDFEKLNSNENFNDEFYYTVVTVDKNSPISQDGYEFIENYDELTNILTFVKKDEDPVWLRRNDNYNEYIGQLQPFDYYFDDDDDTFSFEYYMEAGLDINKVRVDEYDFDEGILDVTIEGHNLPDDGFLISLYQKEINSFSEYDDLYYEDELGQYTMIDEDYFMVGDCAELNDYATELSFEIRYDPDLFHITEDDILTLKLEEGYSTGDGTELNRKVLKTVYIKEPVVETHSAKKYKATNITSSQKSDEAKSNINTDYEAKKETISGTGKKGSTRTITPIEGRKVSEIIVTDNKDNIVDVADNSDGTYSFVQPASNVDVKIVYAPKDIILELGTTNATVYGEKTPLDVAPRLVEDRTCLPARFIAENLECDVLWDEKNPNKVVINNIDTKIEINIGSNIVLVNGKEVEIDVNAFVDGDRTFLPARFIAETFGCIVSWDEKEPTMVYIRQLFN